MLFILLATPVLSFSQSKESIEAFLKSIPVGLGTPVKMPERSLNINFMPEASVNYEKKQRIILIQSDSVYHLVFNQYRNKIDSLERYINGNDSSWYKFMCRFLIDSLPVIDFSKQELVLYSVCGQCLAFCHHEKENSCHRNVCHFMDAWFVRDKNLLYVRKENIH